MQTAQLSQEVFQVNDQHSFNALALKLFRLHSQKNPVYREFLRHLDVNTSDVGDVSSIPFLPISAFKNHKVLLEGLVAPLRFTSSGTSSANTSTHHVVDPELYEESFIKGFIHVYGDPAEYRILGLLPSYLERSGSSLVYMVNELVRRSKDSCSGMYLHDIDELHRIILDSEASNKATLLIGVSYALLDLAEKFPGPLKHTRIIETGGMKGRRREMVRSELHACLKEAFVCEQIHSEYGMTELLSQAWSTGDGIFRCPRWMQVFIRDISDPLTLLSDGKTGGINVIDLANVHSCPFIATDDLGRRIGSGTFEVLGRFDHSDVRGCNLMVL